MDIKVIDNQDIYNLQNRIHNQRKTIKNQKTLLNDLKASLDFNDSELDLTKHENAKLKEQVNNATDFAASAQDGLAAVQGELLDHVDTVKKYKKRYEILKKQNAQHLGKLVALQHVMNRDNSPVALR